MTEIPHRVGALARRAFEAAGYKTLEELLAADEDDLLVLHGVGPRAIRILQEEAPAPVSALVSSPPLQTLLAQFVTVTIYR